MPRGVDTTSPEAAYVTKPNIVHPSYKPTQAFRQAQADEVEEQARVQAAAQGRQNASAEFVTTVPPGALATSGTATTVERDGLKAQT